LEAHPAGAPRYGSIYWAIHRGEEEEKERERERRRDRRRKSGRGH
jgi:hypothetical protein